MTARRETLLALFRNKLGVRAKTLGQAHKKAGRRLPKRLRTQGQTLAQAEVWAVHPKLSRRLDPKAVERAFEDVSAHLSAIDVADRRRGKLLSLAGALAFNLLAVAVLFIVWLWWRAYI